MYQTGCWSDSVIVNNSLPRLFPISMSSCALAASLRSKVVKVVAFNFLVDDEKSGQTVRFKSEATSDLKLSGRDRNVDPVKVRRFSIIGIRSTSIFDPWLKAIWIILASACAAFILRAT